MILRLKSHIDDVLEVERSVRSSKLQRLWEQAADLRQDGPDLHGKLRVLQQVEALETVEAADEDRSNDLRFDVIAAADVINGSDNRPVSAAIVNDNPLSAASRSGASKETVGSPRRGTSHVESFLNLSLKAFLQRPSFGAPRTDRTTSNWRTRHDSVVEKCGEASSGTLSYVEGSGFPSEQVANRLEIPL